MTGSGGVRIDRSRLGTVTRLGVGGQGVVYAAPSLRMQYASALVFKEYKPHVVSGLDVDVLEAMPAYLETLQFSDGMELLSMSAWPCRLVEESGAVVGFVMPAIPSEFFIDMKKASGTQRGAGEFQHLLNGDSFLVRRQILLHDRHRFELLADTARGLAVFHSHGIAVGDLSPKNLLFSLAPHAKVFFIDCDAMRLQGRSVMPQLETPGWEVRAVSPGEELGTDASDSYKLALLALRLFAGDQSTRDPGRLPSSVPTEIRQLVADGLSKSPAARPAPDLWIQPLVVAAASASTSPPVLRRPAATPPGVVPPKAVRQITQPTPAAAPATTPTATAGRQPPVGATAASSNQANAARQRRGMPFLAAIVVGYFTIVIWGPLFGGAIGYPLAFVTGGLLWLVSQPAVRAAIVTGGRRVSGRPRLAMAAGVIAMLVVIVVTGLDGGRLGIIPTIPSRSGAAEDSGSGSSAGASPSGANSQPPVALDGLTAGWNPCEGIAEGGTGGSSADAEPQETAVRVGMVYDTGGRGDLSFNDLAGAGLDCASNVYNLEPREFEPGEGGEDREQLLRLLSTQNSNVVFGVRFLFADAIRAASADFPDVNYVLVDGHIEGLDEDSNVLCISFAEHEGSFLMGAAAALKSETGKIGFLGGVDIGLVKKYQAGFVAGAREVNPDIQIDIKYISQPPDFSGFAAPAMGKEIALRQYNAGADVIYHAAGGSAAGLFEAAREISQGSGHRVWAIGSESDQYQTAPPEDRDYILTSMVKRVDVAVFETIASSINGGHFTGGYRTFDLSDRGVGYSTSGGSIDDIADQVEELRQRIIDGDVTVPESPYG